MFARLLDKGHNPAKHGFAVRPVDQVVSALETAGFAVDRSQVTAGRETGGAPYSLLVCGPA